MKIFHQELSHLSGESDQIKATANVPACAAWYDGHFPGSPILPGVAILALVEEAIIATELREGRRVIMTGIGRVRFRLPVKPNDEMSLRISVEKKRSGLAYDFSVSLEGAMACTGIFRATICIE
jgi:3-hydroxymyristoyl/3-hydroxydecanoyl-(acyl carrier protein) dehydratase